MSEQNKQVPRLRFPGFTDAWVKCTFEDLGIITAGGDVNKKGLLLSGNYPVLANALNNDGIIGYYDDYKVSAPAVTITGRGNIGHAKARKISYTPTVRLISLEPFNSDVDFLENLINTNNFFVESTGVPQLTGPQFGHFEVILPKREEQTKIGKFFQHLDNLITVNERELNKLKNLKKSYLEKMFPKNGSNIPELRFPGYTDAWVKHMVKDIFTVTRGNVLATTKTTSIPTDKSIFPVYSSQTKNDGLMGYYDKFLFQNAITWTTDGANAGTVKYRRGKFYSTNVNGVLLGDFANKATAEILNRIAYKFVSKVGNPKLMNNVMAEIEIFLPNFEEQQRISNLLDKLDNLITVNERELKKLKELKKSYLNDMFV